MDQYLGEDSENQSNPKNNEESEGDRLSFDDGYEASESKVFE